MSEVLTRPRAWISYSATAPLSDAELEALFPDGVPEDLDAGQLVAALKAAHGNDIGGYMPNAWEVHVDVESPNPHWSQDEALFAELAPARTVCTEAYWD